MCLINRLRGSGSKVLISERISSLTLIQDGSNPSAICLKLSLLSEFVNLNYRKHLIAISPHIHSLMNQSFRLSSRIGCLSVYFSAFVESSSIDRCYRNFQFSNRIEILMLF